MPNREKVINGLEWILNDIKENGHYQVYNYEDEIQEALVLLKEQEAKILDLDELEDWDNAVWFEEKDERDCYIALTANVGTYDATFVNVEPGNFHRLVFLREFYKKEWRCWSALPTVKQRREVRWDESD